jgi:hypothetical protein
MYPPAQDHLVCHLSVLPLRPSTPVHCDPEVASALPQRFLLLSTDVFASFAWRSTDVVNRVWS